MPELLPVFGLADAFAPEAIAAVAPEAFGLDAIGSGFAAADAAAAAAAAPAFEGAALAADPLASTFAGIGPSVVDTAGTFGTDITGIGASGLGGTGAFAGGDLGALGTAASDISSGLASGLPATGDVFGGLGPSLGIPGADTALPGLSASSAFDAGALPATSTLAGGVADPFSLASQGLLPSTDPFSGTILQTGASGAPSTALGSTAGTIGTPFTDIAASTFPGTGAAPITGEGVGGFAPSGFAGQGAVFAPTSATFPDIGVPSLDVSGGFPAADTGVVADVSGGFPATADPGLTVSPGTSDFGIQTGMPGTLQGQFTPSDIASGNAQFQNFSQGAFGGPSGTPSLATGISPTPTPAQFSDALAGGAPPTSPFDPSGPPGFGGPSGFGGAPVSPDVASALDATTTPPVPGTPPTSLAPPAATPTSPGFMDMIAKNPMLAASLGIGGAGLLMQGIRMTQGIPDQAQLQAIAAQLQSSSQQAQAQAQGLIAPLITGQLPGPQAAQVQQALNDAVQVIKARHATSDPGSSAENNEIASAIQQSIVASGQLEQQMATAGISLSGQATQSLNVESSIFQFLIGEQINLQNAFGQAISNFAGQAGIASAISGLKA